MMYGIYKINFRPPNSGGECFFSSHEYILYSECGESQYCVYFPVFIRQ